MSSWNEPPSIFKSLKSLDQKIGVTRTISQFAGVGQNVDPSAFGSGAKSYNNGTFMGVTSLNPFTNTVTLVSGFYHVDLMSTNFLVDDPSTSTITLHYIDGRFAKGQIIRIRPVKGKTLTLKKAADLTGTKGNLYLDADVTMLENEFLDLMLSDDFGTSGVGMYIVEKGGSSSSGFTNPATSDLDMNRFNILNVPLISFKNTSIDSAQRTINFTSNGLQYYTDNSAGPNPLQHSFWIGLNNIFNIRAGEVDCFKTLNMENNFVTNINQLQFASTGGLMFLSTSGDGKVLNFTLNGLFNVFNMSVTSGAGIIEAISTTSSSPPAYKLFQSASPILNQSLGSINFDGISGINQKSYVVLSAIVSNISSNGTGKFVVSNIQSGTLLNQFSVDANNNTVLCQGTLLKIDSTANDPSPNNLPLTLDTISSFASYANSGGHLFQNAAKTTFYFGASKPNVFYQGISMVVNARSGASYTVDATNGSGSDLIITMTDNAFTRNVTLPDANTFIGRLLIIKNLGTKAVFFVTVGGQTVDGQASGAYSLAAQYASAILFSSGGEWFVAAKV